MGERKPAAERKPIQIRFDQKTREALEKLKEDSGGGFQHHVTKAVKEYLERLKAKK